MAKTSQKLNEIKIKTDLTLKISELHIQFTKKNVQKLPLKFRRSEKATKT